MHRSMADLIDSNRLYVCQERVKGRGMCRLFQFGDMILA